MPYKSNSLKIEHTKYDRRIKLKEEDKKDILLLSKNGLSRRAIAKKFGVSRRSIHLHFKSSISYRKPKKKKRKRRMEGILR